MNELNRLAVVYGVCPAQYRVTLDKRLGGAFQRRHIDVTRNPPRIGDGVGRAGRRELMEEPQGPLSVRQRMHRGGNLRLRRRLVRRGLRLVGAEVGSGGAESTPERRSPSRVASRVMVGPSSRVTTGTTMPKSRSIWVRSSVAISESTPRWLRGSSMSRRDGAR